MGNLVTRQIPALFNGVSQQPATLRVESQCEAMVNAYATVADGLRKRPGFAHIAKITNDDLASAYLHTINRDTSQRFIVVVTDGDLKVYDLAGNEITVTFPQGKDYLAVPAGQTANAVFSVVSIADYSFVVNRSITVDTKVPPVTPPAAVGSWYFPPSWFPDGAEPDDLKPYYNATTGRTYRGSKQVFGDLPRPEDDTPPLTGDVWKIAGFGEDSVGTHYVVRVDGIWEETWGPGTEFAYDEETMPWALVRTLGGEFVFTTFPWKTRQVGDDTSNPAATFTGRTIRDVFYYKNRLGFVSDENVVFSGAGDFGNFWRTSIPDLLDTDYVDVAVSGTKVSNLHYAVPFNGGLMMFADQSQFQLNTGEGLTPANVSIDTVTEFEMSTRVRPVGVGTDVFFVSNSGRYSRIREYFVQEDSKSNDATDITSHVPRYVPRGIFAMAGSTNEDVIFAVSDEEPSRLYCYKFFWTGADKAQSAWGYWQIEADARVLTISMLENRLYLVVQRPDGVYIEEADIQSGAITGDLDHQVLLDRLTDDLVASYDSIGDQTIYTLPYPVTSAHRAAFRLVRGEDYAGQTLTLIDPSTYSWSNDTTVRVPGNELGGTLYAGQRFVMEYEFSEQFMRTGDQSSAVTTGRLMLRTFVLYFQDSAYFKTSVAPYGNDPLVETVVPATLSEFTGKTIGDPGLILNEPVFATGRYAFQVHGDSKSARIKLINDSHVQTVFQSVEWEALYFNRARTIG